MAQVLVTESYLDDIADAIRDKTGGEDTYTPGQMAGAINGIHTADEVVLVSKSVTANGTYNPASDSADGYSGVSVNVPNTYTTADNGKVVVNQALADQTSKSINANGTHDTTANNSVVVDVPNSYSAADEGKVVSGGVLVGQTSLNVTTNGTYDTTENNEVVVNVPTGGGGSLIQKTITQNGTYNASDDNADGYSSVMVNVQGGGGSYPVADAFLNGRLSMIINLGNYAYGSYLQTDSQYVKNFLMHHARDKFGSTKGTSSAYGVIAQEVAITPSDLQGTLDAFVAKFSVLSSAEYYGYVYNQTQILSDIGAVLLGDFSQGGSATGNALNDSISNYSAVLLQGIYNKTRNSAYNTSMLYVLPELNTSYWTGMKDRNTSYDCNVTFTDDSTVSLSGNRQVIIYGIPL